LRVISIDLGSNSIRALKVDCNRKETLGHFSIKLVRNLAGLG